MYIVKHLDKWYRKEGNVLATISFGFEYSYYSPLKCLLGEILYKASSSDLIIERIERFDIKHNNINVSL